MTSIDTTPSLCSRIFVRLLRYTRPKCVNGIIIEPNFWHDVKSMLALALTLVTSSLFVYYLQAKDAEDATCVQSSFYHKMDSVLELNTAINQNVKDISEKLDSVVLSHKQFSVVLRKMNKKK